MINPYPSRVGAYWVQIKSLESTHEWFWKWKPPRNWWVPRSHKIGSMPIKWKWIHVHELIMLNSYSEFHPQYDGGMDFFKGAWPETGAFEPCEKHLESSSRTVLKTCWKLMQKFWVKRVVPPNLLNVMFLANNGYKFTLMACYGTLWHPCPPGPWPLHPPISSTTQLLNQHGIRCTFES